MMQRVKVTVVGTQLDVTPQEMVKTKEVGELYQKGETAYIIYDQGSEDSIGGVDVVHHRIKLRGQTVELNRKGAGQQSRMVFREGESYCSTYVVSGMAMALELRTKCVQIIKQKHKWQIVLEYELLLEGQHASHNRTRILVEE